MKRLCCSFVGSTIIEWPDSLYVVGLGNASKTITATITARPPKPEPIKIFFCDKFDFGFAGSVNKVITINYPMRLILVMINSFYD